MHAVDHTRAKGVRVQISQSVQTCVSPAFGSLNGPVSMCTSAALTTAPLIVGSLTIGALGGVLPLGGALSSKLHETSSCTSANPPVAAVKPTNAWPASS